MGKIAFLLLPIAVFFTSCQREIHCLGCAEENKPPVARAGSDTTIFLPTDSILLDGSHSTDPDGRITAWLWTKVAGSDSAIIINSTSATPCIKNLVGGTYQFELIVTDDRGLSASDTMLVKVSADTTSGNKPPTACAGQDKTVTLLQDTATLDGSCSTDPDNNITSYQWRKIQGLGAEIANPTSSQTVVNNLEAGVYLFELKVTDAGGLWSKDTVQLTVEPAVVNVACDGSSRPTFQAQLMPIGKLAKARQDVAVAAAGTKVVFAGGAWTSECPECWGSPQVDIYDTATKTWTTAKLSTGRWGVTAIAAGKKIFFAGGAIGDGGDNSYFTNVDIYDVLTNHWTVAHLSETRSHIGAVAQGDNVFFAGGEKNSNYECSDRVDIYSLPSNSWFTATLSIPRAFLSAVSADNKVYFAGGTLENRWLTTSNHIDIYDTRTNAWSTSTLKVHKGIIEGTALKEDIYWSQDCPVEIRSAHNDAIKLASLSRQVSSYPVVKNNKVVFISGSDRFDVYDPANGMWSVGLLPRSVKINGDVVSHNNTIYLTDGEQVYKLEF
jgi:hypothetical protein